MVVHLTAFYDLRGKAPISISSVYRGPPFLYVFRWSPYAPLGSAAGGKSATTPRFTSR
jgi:hypothetical protein